LRAASRAASSYDISSPVPSTHLTTSACLATLASTV
jgi:hypothetical protein